MIDTRIETVTLYKGDELIIVNSDEKDSFLDRGYSTEKDTPRRGRPKKTEDESGE